MKSQTSVLLPTPTDPRCRGDHVFSSCATSCGLSCENYHLPPSRRPLCDGFCFEGCACPPGLIPLGNGNAECVLPEECDHARCPRGQVFRECGNSCGITCDNYYLPPELQPICAAVCFPGCFCDDGLIPLGHNSDRCVPRDRCPTAVCTRPRQTRPCGYGVD